MKKKIKNLILEQTVTAGKSILLISKSFVSTVDIVGVE